MIHNGEEKSREFLHSTSPTVHHGQMMPTAISFPIDRSSISKEKQLSRNFLLVQRPTAIVVTTVTVP